MLHKIGDGPLILAHRRLGLKGDLGGKQWWGKWGGNAPLIWDMRGLESTPRVANRTLEIMAHTKAIVLNSGCPEHTIVISSISG